MRRPPSCKHRIGVNPAWCSRSTGNPGGTPRIPAARHCDGHLLRCPSTLEPGALTGRGTAGVVPLRTKAFTVRPSMNLWQRVGRPHNTARRQAPAQAGTVGKYKRVLLDLQFTRFSFDSLPCATSSNHVAMAGRGWGESSSAVWSASPKWNQSWVQLM